RLAAWDNVLAPRLGLRDADGSTFRPTEPGNGSCAGFVVFVHGLCNSELDWQTPAHRRLVTELRDAGRMVAWLRYNSGRAIHENGCELADLLEARSGVAGAETPIALVGHSMGGLVIRSACQEAAARRHAWLARLTHA